MYQDVSRGHTSIGLFGEWEFLLTGPIPSVYMTLLILSRDRLFGAQLLREGNDCLSRFQNMISVRRLIFLPNGFGGLGVAARLCAHYSGCFQESAKMKKSCCQLLLEPHRI